jgi:hydrogenase/urease accessory protein HupE
MARRRHAGSRLARVAVAKSVLVCIATDRGHATVASVTGGSGASFGTFFELGVTHILRGHDHLLFLLGLWIVCVRWQQLVWIVTSFTVAHSLTLAAATLGWVRVPDAFIEPAIAATIAFVGIENIVRRGEPKGRVVVTFAFGLLHGFGFSNVLRAALAGAGSDVPFLPLLAFNLGVETGQLVATAIGLPLIWWLRRQTRTKRHVVPVGSGIVALAGLFWLVERLMA